MLNVKTFMESQKSETALLLPKEKREGDQNNEQPIQQGTYK